MRTALLLLQAITTNNLDINFGTVMIFGGILEGVWPINNQKRWRSQHIKPDFESSDLRDADFKSSVLKSRFLWSQMTK